MKDERGNGNAVPGNGTGGRNGPGPDADLELPPERLEEEYDDPLSEAAFAEALRAGPELVDIAVSLILTAFPDRQVMRGAAGRLAALYTDPPLSRPERKRLLGYLFELVERPEWQERYAVAREVQDVRGTRLELLLPLAPTEYDGGEAVVGPFADEEAARSWASGIAEPGLAFDTVAVQGGYLVDLFQLGELLDDDRA